MSSGSVSTPKEDDAAVASSSTTTTARSSATTTSPPTSTLKQPNSNGGQPAAKVGKRAGSVSFNDQIHHHHQNTTPPRSPQLQAQQRPPLPPASPPSTSTSPRVMSPVGISAISKSPNANGIMNKKNGADDEDNEGHAFPPVPSLEGSKQQVAQDLTPESPRSPAEHNSQQMQGGSDPTMASGAAWRTDVGATNEKPPTTTATSKRDSGMYSPNSFRSRLVSGASETSDSEGPGIVHIVRPSIGGESSLGANNDSGVFYTPTAMGGALPSGGGVGGLLVSTGYVTSGHPSPNTATNESSQTSLHTGSASVIGVYPLSITASSSSLLKDGASFGSGGLNGSNNQTYRTGSDMSSILSGKSMANSHTSPTGPQAMTPPLTISNSNHLFLSSIGGSHSSTTSSNETATTMVLNVNTSGGHFGSGSALQFGTPSSTSRNRDLTVSGDGSSVCPTPHGGPPPGGQISQLFSVVSATSMKPGGAGKKSLTEGFSMSTASGTASGSLSSANHSYSTAGRMPAIKRFGGSSVSSDMSMMSIGGASAADPHLFFHHSVSEAPSQMGDLSAASTTSTFVIAATSSIGHNSSITQAYQSVDHGDDPSPSLDSTVKTLTESGGSNGAMASISALIDGINPIFPFSESTGTNFAAGQSMGSRGMSLGHRTYNPLHPSSSISGGARVKATTPPLAKGETTSRSNGSTPSTSRESSPPPATASRQSMKEQQQYDIPQQKVVEAPVMVSSQPGPAQHLQQTKTFGQLTEMRLSKCDFDAEIPIFGINNLEDSGTHLSSPPTATAVGKHDAKITSSSSSSTTSPTNRVEPESTVAPSTPGSRHDPTASKWSTHWKNFDDHNTIDADFVEKHSLLKYVNRRSFLCSVSSSSAKQVSTSDIRFCSSNGSEVKEGDDTPNTPMASTPGMNMITKKNDEKVSPSGLSSSCFDPAFLADHLDEAMQEQHEHEDRQDALEFPLSQDFRNAALKATIVAGRLAFAEQQHMFNPTTDVKTENNNNAASTGKQTTSELKNDDHRSGASNSSNENSLKSLFAVQDTLGGGGGGGGGDPPNALPAVPAPTAQPPKGAQLQPAAVLIDDEAALMLADSLAASRMSIFFANSLVATDPNDE